MALTLCAIASPTWLLLARVLGPSDLWDQTQPKTVSYTTDILVHGGTHWLLPIERGELPATKPPLYNWIAAPAVKALGFDSEIAHKLPSVIALVACWLMIVRLGRWLDRGSGGGDESLGWLAGLIFLANYSTFKLGYLARPDMLLTLWLLIAWWSATRALIAARSLDSPSPKLALCFWLAIALAGLTKGPAALVGIAYAIVAARVIGGRWRTIRSLYLLLGALLAAIVCGAWIVAVWKLDPAHLREELWFNEFWGRVTGLGSEGTHDGTREWLRELPYQSVYFLTRFAPWSFIALLGTLALARRLLFDNSATFRLAASLAIDTRRWMLAAALFTIITVALFSLSIGKRADYIAIAIPQASLLAAWWLLQSASRLAAAVRFVAPLAGAIALAICTWYNQRETTAPAPGFGDAILRFARQANAAIAADPAPLHAVGAGQTHLQAIMGLAEDDVRHRLDAIIEREGEFWVIAGRLQNHPHDFDLWLSKQRRLRSQATAVVRSETFPAGEGWPEQVTLWRVTPADRSR